MILLDTNIVILYTQDDPDITKWIEDSLESGNSFCISSVTVVELLSFPKITEEETRKLEQWLESILVVEVNMPIARQAASLRREFGITTMDSIIAATAIQWQLPIATHDKAFLKIKNLDLIDI